eukprot:933666_1
MDKLYAELKEVYRECSQTSAPTLLWNLLRDDLCGIISNGLGFRERGELDFLVSLGLVNRTVGYMGQALSGGLESFNEILASYPEECKYNGMPPNGDSEAFLCCWLRLVNISARHRVNASWYVEQGALQMLLRLLVTFMDRRRVVMGVFVALSSLASNHGKELALLNESVTNTVQVVRRFENDEAVLDRAFAFVEQLVVTQYPHARGAYLQRFDGVRMVIGALKRFPRSDVLHAAGTGLLNRAIYSNDAVQEMLREQGPDFPLVNLCPAEHVNVQLGATRCRRCNVLFNGSPEEDVDMEGDGHIRLPMFDLPHTIESYTTSLSVSPLPDVLVGEVVDYLYVLAKADFPLDVLDCVNKWCRAKVIEVHEPSMRIKIHYEDFSSIWDEWLDVNSERIAHQGSYTNCIKTFEGRARIRTYE